MYAPRSLQQILPPPLFLRLPSVGVDISDTSLKYIQFVPHGRSGELAIEHYGELPLEPGVVTRGDVQDLDALTSALATVRKRTKTAYVRLSLPEERAYLFETRIKHNTPFKEIRGSLEFRLEENVPLSPRDAYFDYDLYTIPNVTDEFGVSVTAYGCSTVNSYYDACTRAGFVPLSFEVEAQAITRAVLPENTSGACLIVDFGKTRTGVGIVLDGILMYTSTIDVGGNELSTALRRQLGEEDEGELTKVKNTQGLAEGTESREALIVTMSVIKDELMRRIEYWNHRDVDNEDRFIERVFICGGTSNLKGLPEYLTNALGIETVRANVWQNAFAIEDSVPPIDQPHAYGYATAIGLALTNLM